MAKTPMTAKGRTRRPRSSAYGGARTIDGYLARVEPAQRAALEAVRQVIRKAAPKAEEVISYGIACFRQDGPLIGFAASATHCSLHPMNNHTVADFATELAGYHEHRHDSFFAREAAAGGVVDANCPGPDQGEPGRREGESGDEGPEQDAALSHVTRLFTPGPSSCTRPATEWRTHGREYPTVQSAGPQAPDC
jgi:uncharacterized protein YdhG (YjbR/CyaY superfamily)